MVLWQDTLRWMTATGDAFDASYYSPFDRPGETSGDIRYQPLEKYEDKAQPNHRLKLTLARLITPTSL